MTAPEARSGLPPWSRTELPEPPRPRGLQWISTVGPGIIVLGVSIGSGEFLLGPATFVKYGLTLLWVTLAAAFLQTVLNTELMRYTLATGEPAFTGFMRTRPKATFWGWAYGLLYVLQVGWPAWSGVAAGAVFFLIAGRLAGTADTNVVYLIGVGTYAICVLTVLVGRRIERTLEILNWVLLVTILSVFFVLALIFAAPETWLAMVGGFVGLDTRTMEFRFIPRDADYFLLGAFAAYSGAGGVGNITLTNWARDKGYGMGKHAGFISGAVGGERVELAHSGFTFDVTPEAMQRWRGWWRIVRVDQWGIFFLGALMGMALPALLYVTFLPAGADIRGLGVAAALSGAMAERGGPALGITITVLGAWLLVKTQLDILEGTVRALTDLLWTANARVRQWRGGDVRVVYYLVLGVVVAWGLVALRLAQPIFLLQLGANMGGIVMMVSSLHVLYVNMTLLPVALRPPMWRRVMLVVMSCFYGVFVGLWLWSLVR
jgi:hypothetical protein